MTRAKAIDRVNKLREICVERGATAHEAATAAALAAELTTRFALDRPVPAGRHTARYATCATTDRRAPRALRFVVFA